MMLKMESCDIRMVLLLFMVGLPRITGSFLSRFDYGFDPRPMSDYWGHTPVKCDLNCDHGLEHDVEGRAICKCFNPCRSVKCFGGNKCVVEMPSKCESHMNCRSTAICKAVAPNELKEKEPYPTKPKEVKEANHIKIEENHTVEPKPNKDNKNVCKMPRDITFKCNQKFNRWYYDKKTRKCKKFYGCPSEGNNFARKRDCKKMCKNNKSSKRRKAIKWQRKKMLLDAEFHWYKHNCPTDSVMVNCSTDPCIDCTNRRIKCVQVNCGECKALYLHKRSGRILEKCSLR
ncbi:unnamed protein product [Owenia fusiformis]|uniref:BPTI/Kunitz inhibitor domain-containing protein n=1 Tax=Owenia fusiformis TaxID=6347 RepID=A0A8S4PCF2_OWEFU|nr:unnamed protein product [Owenia fusiformis]